jgi:arylsulfatase A-like enzyme/Tfp pilus assembly protein PilF
MRINLKVQTLAEHLQRAGFATGAFVAAFPLDRRFGLVKGFRAYGDEMPRDPSGHVANERPGQAVVDEALPWLERHRQGRFFLWIHLFEPHAPYGNPEDPAQARRPAEDRYDDEIAEADRQIQRVIDALGPARESTLIVAAADHGEAFGEHGEIGHSLFTYDTTLRVPLIVAGPAIPEGRVVDAPVSLVDVAPTIAAQTGTPALDADGIDLTAAMNGAAIPSRALYAESFAPLLDFGWSPLRTLRAGGWKYIAAPKPELYELSADPGETHNVVETERTRAAQMADRVQAISSDRLADARASTDPEAVRRLQSLGYVSGGADRGGSRPDPKDRRDLAAAIARVTSGELQGNALEQALRGILRQDPGNPQANLRLGYVLLDKGSCDAATPYLRAAIDAHLPSADPYLGIAGCEAEARRFAAAERTLREADRVEPDNPVVAANLGIVLSDSGRPADGVPYLQRALTLAPDLHQARFSLAIAYARLGRRADARAEAQRLLDRLPKDAPQRPEVERLLTSVR